MEIQGKVVRILPLRSGMGKTSEWKKQEFVVEIEGRFPKQVCFSLWGEKVDQYPLNEGEGVVVHFDLESREYNERWYTDARAWKIDKPTATPGAHAEDRLPPVGATFSADAEDDLPF